MKTEIVAAIAAVIAGPAIAEGTGASATGLAPAQSTPLGGAAFPERALTERVEGSARVACTVVANGLLSECHVASESPAGYGFGESALKAVATRQVDSARFAPGAKVAFPVRFNLPPPSEPVGPIARYYPARALRENQEGRVGLRCEVQNDGALRGCGIVSEQPANFGFGEAALKISAVIHLDTSNPKYAAGSTITLPVDFRLPPKAQAPVASAP